MKPNFEACGVPPSETGPTEIKRMEKRFEQVTPTVLEMITETTDTDTREDIILDWSHRVTNRPKYTGHLYRQEVRRVWRFELSKLRGGNILSK